MFPCSPCSSRFSGGDGLFSDRSSFLDRSRRGPLEGWFSFGMVGAFVAMLLTSLLFPDRVWHLPYWSRRYAWRHIRVGRLWRIWNWISGIGRNIGRTRRRNRVGHASSRLPAAVLRPCHGEASI